MSKTMTTEEIKGRAIERFRSWLGQDIHAVEQAREHLGRGDVRAADDCLFDLWLKLHRQHQS